MGVTALTRAVPGERNKKHEKFFQEIRDIFGTLSKYRKIPKIRLGAYIRKGLSSEGHLRFKLDWASPVV